MKSNGRHTRPLLSVEDLVVSYYKKEILHGASLNVMPGEIVALIGANGSGKSTLLKAVAGVIRSSSGMVSFDGESITNKEPYEIVKRGMGFLMQGGSVFPGLTVAEHLWLATEGLDKQSPNQRIEDAYSLFPMLAEVRGKRAGLLSGGERQMLGLASVLVQRPKLLLLDEPSGGVAPKMLKSIFDVITRLNKESGIATLVVEQNIVEAVRISDRVYIVKDGRTRVEEHPKEILNNGKLEEVFFH
jgi:ABC-type branched-subunit amino acid transport system ATPase component